MIAERRGQADLRVLIFAPRGRDAAVVATVLGSADHTCLACSSLDHLVDCLHEGAGLAFITEEALAGDGLEGLKRWLTQQPPWSDFPIIVLATKQSGRRSAQALSTLQDLGNVVLLERPLNAETLVSAARSAHRARMRQYQTRLHLLEQERIGRENERLYTAERLALQDAAEAQQTLDLAVGAAELGTFHCPLPLGDVVWNDICKAHFWLPIEAAVDMDLFYSRLDPEDRARTRAAIASAIDDGQAYDVEFRTVSPMGQRRWIRAKGRAFYDEQGRATRFDGITIDISRQKALQEERETLLAAEREARLQAEQASLMKDEFLATLSHELRTPLSAILGWVHVLKVHAAGMPAVLKGVETVERNARSQARLIEELLDMSRINSGSVQLERQRLMPADIVESVIASLGPAAQAKSVHIERRVDPDAGPVEADPQRLQQIVGNLLNNALKFTPDGGRIELVLQNAQRELVLSVCDSGIGISAEFLPFVFERFRQEDGSTTRRHGGLGLGLAIVRHLVELHGGSVDAASDGLGRGATFTVRFPLSRSHRPKPEAGRVPSLPAERNAAGWLRGLLVVLVDDEPDALDMLSSILTDEGVRVKGASSADEALHMVRDEPADLLISDIGMPRVDGYQLIASLRELGHSLPAIALTAFARAEDRHRALAAGYSAHLAKPVEPAELLSAVASLTGRTALQYE